MLSDGLTSSGADVDAYPLLSRSPRIELDDRPVEIPSRKAVALLAYLALTGQAHTRERLAAFFWPEADTEHARGALRAALVALRRALGDAWIAAEGDTLSLRAGDRSQDTGVRIELDVAHFRAETVATRTHAHAANAACPACQARRPLPPTSTAATCWPVSPCPIARHSTNGSSSRRKGCAAIWPIYCNGWRPTAPPAASSSWLSRPPGVGWRLTRCTSRPTAA